MADDNEQYLRLEALKAAQVATQGYNDSGMAAPGAPDAVLAAAVKFLDFLKGPKPEEASNG